ncbi:MAG: CheR family methyltransferase [Planctomycetota bacterium]
MDIAPETYRKLSDLIARSAGIRLGAEKERMLQNRLSKRLRQLNCPSYEAYLSMVLADRNRIELQELLDAVTTNYTSFFRDRRQFDHLGQYLQRLLTQGRPKLRIWSAACSTGEEAYSIAITARMAMASVSSHTKVRILATDIATPALEQASQGWYERARVCELKPYERRFFKLLQLGRAPEPSDRMSVDDKLRKMVIFRRANLCEHPLSVPDDIDVIFCRNVLLYFDTQMQNAIVRECLGKLRPGGLICFGASESVSAAIGGAARYVAPSIFQRPPLNANPSSQPASC